MSCHSDGRSEIHHYGMTSGDDSIIRLFNLQGKLLTSIQTKSGKRPSDITVTKSGHLICTVPSDRYVNMVQNTKISKKIRLMEFIPINICYTLFDDILVMMVKHDNTESMVARYSAFKATQCIPETQVNLDFPLIFQSKKKMRAGIRIFVLLIILQTQY